MEEIIRRKHAEIRITKKGTETIYEKCGSRRFKSPAQVYSHTHAWYTTLKRLYYIPGLDPSRLPEPSGLVLACCYDLTNNFISHLNFFRHHSQQCSQRIFTRKSIRVSVTLPEAEEQFPIFRRLNFLRK